MCFLNWWFFFLPCPLVLESVVPRVLCTGCYNKIDNENHSRSFIFLGRRNSSHFNAHSFIFFFQNCLPSVSCSQFLIVLNHILYLMTYIPVRVPLDVENTCINNKQNDHYFFPSNKGLKKQTVCWIFGRQAESANYLLLLINPQKYIPQDWSVGW